MRPGLESGGQLPPGMHPTNMDLGHVSGGLRGENHNQTHWRSFGTTQHTRHLVDAIATKSVHVGLVLVKLGEHRAIAVPRAVTSARRVPDSGCS